MSAVTGAARGGHWDVVVTLLNMGAYAHNAEQVRSVLGKNICSDMILFLKPGGIFSKCFLFPPSLHRMALRCLCLHVCPDD